MTDTDLVFVPAEPKPVPSKSDIVRRLLSRKNGATAAEIGEATSWQPHSVRAYVTGLRKKGSTIAFEPRRDGTKAYRLTSLAAVPTNG